MIGHWKSVLLIDEDKRERRETALVLGRAGFIVVQAGDGLDALGEMRMRRFDAVVTDCHMPGLSGFEFLAQSRVTWSDTPVIIVSETRWDLSDMAMSRGAFAWIRKSSDPGILLSMLTLAVEQGAEWESRHAMEQVGA